MNFVNFETAKKLKEKVFKEQCLAYYSPDSDFYYNVSCGGDVEDAFKSFNSRPNLICGKRVDAPTISQVLKWLRDEKDIFIQLEYINQKACGCTIIKQKTGGVIAKYNCDKFQYVNKNPLVGNTYEQAALAGIRYALDKLI